MMDFIRQYFHNLKKAYIEILTVLATLVTVAIDTSKSTSFLGWNLLAIFFLLIYIGIVFSNNYKLTKSITRNVNAVFSICLGKGREVFQDDLRKQISTLNSANINVTKLFEHFNVLDTDWQCYLSEENIPSKWETEIYRIYDRFFIYAQRLPVKTQFHLFFRVPIPIALALGYAIGKYGDWVVYHFHNSKYLRIPYDNQEIRKTYPSNFTYITITEKNTANFNDRTIALSLIPKSIIEIPRINNQYIEITPKGSVDLNNGIIAAKVLAEIRHVLEENLRDGKRIHLYPGIPSALAFLIGKSFQEQAPISVYNPNKETKQWDCVFSLDNLSKF